MTDLGEQSPFTVVKRHVYGHQDTLGRNLNLLERLNCKMDHKAKEIARHHMNQDIDNLEFKTHRGVSLPSDWLIGRYRYTKDK